MIQPAIQKGIVIAACLCFSCIGNAQGKTERKSDQTISVSAKPKPYRILTNGKKITVQGNSNLNKILVWTASGYRIIEQTNLNVSNFSFEVRVKETIFFLLLEFVNGKRFTEKIGVK